MNEEYAHSYSVLGLQPGSNWSAVRDAYKNLIKQWHPDRYQQDGQQRRVAEERSMEITRAYKTLADYYRTHGRTPVNPDPAPAQAAAETSPPTNTPSGGATHTEKAAAANIHTQTRTHRSPARPAEAKQWKAITIVIAIALLAYLWTQEEPSENSQNAATIPNLSGQNLLPTEPADKITAHPADKFFTHGSKLGEVYAIQGIPSRTEEGIWYYGQSRVYFVNGSVSHWDSHPENPLNASLHTEPVATEKDFIRKGSTKAEVRALQGTPWGQTEREWTYGSSRIFFSDEVVTGWKDSALNPLKVRN